MDDITISGGTGLQPAGHGTGRTRARVICTLTTDSAASSHGIPVLHVETADGAPVGDYGPADVIGGPSGKPAAYMVLAWLEDNTPTIRQFGAVRRYLRQWPDGPQAPVAAAVRTYRKARGLTQTDAAERVGMTQPRWAEIESGRIDPKITTLERVAAALECDVRDLV